MKRIGEVIKLTADSAEIRLLGENGESAVIEAVNETAAKVGDTVEIETSAKGLFASAALAYILPTALALIVYFAVRVAARDGTAAGLSALAVFSVAFIVVGALLKGWAAPDTRIKIVRIVKTANKEK